MALGRVCSADVGAPCVVEDSEWDKPRENMKYSGTDLSENYDAMMLPLRLTLPAHFGDAESEERHAVNTRTYLHCRGMNVSLERRK